MELEIEKLLANLNSATIKYLPCFIGQANSIVDINFRIGLSDGPHIRFRQTTSEYYTLFIRDEHQRFYEHPIIIGTDQFMICQSIRDKIISLVANAEYIAARESKLSVMLSSLINVIAPVISKSIRENR